jgi:hypothetical protein
MEDPPLKMTRSDLVEPDQPIGMDNMEAEDS